MKLISMTELVLLCNLKRKNGTMTDDKFVQSITAYALFISQPLTLEMFIPADDIRKLPGGEMPSMANNPFFPELEDKVLFKDLAIKYTDLDKKFYITKKSTGFFVISGPASMFKNNLRIEDLVHRELELTDTAIKLIFG